MLSDEERKAVEWFQEDLAEEKENCGKYNDYKKQVKIIENLFKEIENNDKRWENKIKAKIVECREILYSFEKELELKANKDKFIYKESMNCLLGQISVLQSLLERSRK